MKSFFTNAGTKHYTVVFFFSRCQGYLVMLPPIGIGGVTVWCNCCLPPLCYCCQFLLSQINPDSWPDASCASQQDSGLKRASGYKEILQQAIQSILFPKNININTEEKVFSSFTNTLCSLNVGVCTQLFLYGFYLYRINGD